MEILPLGDSALLVRLDRLKPTEALERLRSAAIPGVVELTAAYKTVAVFYDVNHAEQLADHVQKALATVRKTRRRKAAPRVVEIPVCYAEEFAVDLEVIAKHSKLEPEEVIRRHAAVDYEVSCIGFTPGFPYLSGLPAELATPRRAVPRKRVPAGAVAIGGAQAGIYPQESPGGWNIIGRTPLRLFDVTREQPALLAAGDHVRFVQITREEFERQCR